MVLLPGQRDAVLPVAHDIGHHTDLFARHVQRWPLLDMQFDKAGELRGVHIGTHPAPQCLPRFGQLDAIRIHRSVCFGQGHET